MINTDKPARMGQYVKQHKPVFNRHTIIHSFRRNHFAFPPSAIITQQKKIPDVSFWQGVIDWDKMRTKTDAVIIRAGQGYWGTDSQWLNNWGKAKERGMLRGCYWFYDDRQSPGAQAAKLVSLIQDDKPELECVIDWETYYGGNYGGLHEVVSMMQEVERLAPWVKVALYSGFYWYTGNSNPISNASQYNYLKGKALWLAWYTNDASIVKIPAPWDALWMWQYGTPAEGLDYGVRTAEIDQNYFNGTEAEFYQRYQGVTPPPPTNGETMKGIVNSGFTLMVRDSANADTGLRLAVGDVVYGPVTNNRIYFERIYRRDGTVQQEGGNAATVDPANSTVRWMTLSNEAEPTPDPPAAESYLEMNLAPGSTYKLVINGEAKAEGTV